MRKLYRLFLYCGFFLFLGCDSQHAVQQSFDDYKSDLSRSRWFDLPPLKALVQPLPLPSLNDRRSELTQFDISVLDFLSLQQCSIGSVVGYKNSILGKVMPDSQRLLYELNLIHAIDTCQIDSDSLRAELLSIRHVKQKELTRAFANSLWAGEESEAFFSLSNGIISMSPHESSFLPLQSAFSYLQRVQTNLNTIPQLSSAELEGHFQTIYQSEYAGRLLQTLRLISSNLNQISNALQMIEANEAFCGKPILFLKQQFKRHYIEKLQPYMARINRVAFNVLPVLNALREQTQPLSSDFNRFLQQWSMIGDGSVWGGYQMASKRHALEWNRLFNQCQLSYK
ncbi:DUF3080 family protein [Marinomonas sp. 15G1-11]|uniref:DUF3080 family protein n=1 Tax=Marinomonas phaeophyticola TaxID=3004091 RepID=A0ABT4JS12_9GAMM|nr:DUF3080 family protein [Marinomonas sp. 15G1-11]MCZ2721145.1 DUF3080 family protein [Marinomonas sp. 15G1-11]